MFTDLVGYSSMTSLDEAMGLRLLDQHRTLLGSVFERFGGRVIKTMGDGFLVEFASAVEAVNCAVQAQTEALRFNEGRKQGEGILVRIGIHVGDIVHSNGDILGDAVNVAARLQALAEAGGICMTRQVVDQIEGKVQYKISRLGTRGLKNVKHAVELYKVEVPVGLSETEEPGLDPRRIAILPFANLSADPNDRYFADGMTEELISTISRIDELSVISRTSVMRYRDTTMPIGEIGRELSAGTLLEGSVRKAGNKLRITTQLIDAKNDKHLWVQSYDRDMTDIFAIQADIAEQVAEALEIRLVSKEKMALQKRQTGNPESYTLYLKGRYTWNDRTGESVRKAIKYFEEAVRLDPNFALAYSGLADCYNILENRGIVPHSEAGALAKGYAEKALELDSEMAEAHASLGLVLESEWHLTGAEKELRRAIALKPNYAMAYHWYAGLLGVLGRNQEALEQEKRALDLDPHSSVVALGIGIELICLGKYREAVAQLEGGAEKDPNFAAFHFFNAWAHERLGEFDQAINEAKRAEEMLGGPNPTRLNLASIYARTGKRDEAAKLLEEVQSDSSQGYIPPTLFAMVKFQLGERDEAISWLQRAYREHDSMLLYFREWPWLAEFRSDPKWLEIERKMGLAKT